VSAPHFRRPREVSGPRLRFRDATPAHAEFILGLRLDPKKGEHLSPTDSDLMAQRRWLEAYAGDSSQVYFIIEDGGGQAVGTVRLYDARGSSFCWGSWILADQAPKSSAVESTLMVYAFALACGFTGAHFDVRHGNEKVWQYHERFGAVRVGEDALNFHYEIGEPQIRAALERYRERIPDGVVIAWE
jgi:RimJ/RimL family protein N-acetyltransferase